MRSSAKDAALVVDLPDAKISWSQWGDMTVERGTILGEMDITPLFKGLPNDRCQCPHWGYIIKGEMHFINNEGQTEVFTEGDFYHIAPNHLPTLLPGLEYVEYSPNDALAKTMEVVEKNMAAMMAAAPTA